MVRTTLEGSYRARIKYTAGNETTRCGASTFYPRPQNGEKNINQVRALPDACGIAL
ncbi:MAG: hypothetical protein LBV27_05290 [Oscillospiraceae bacterium]|nr:hypothetical protein [Oscillospiraceae bacterium]